MPLACHVNGTTMIEYSNTNKTQIKIQTQIKSQIKNKSVSNPHATAGHVSGTMIEYSNTNTNTNRNKQTQIKTQIRN